MRCFSVDCDPPGSISALVKFQTDPLPTALAVPKQAGPKALPLCQRPKQNPQGDGTKQNISPLPLLVSAHKTHVKPSDRKSPRQSTSFACPISSTPTAILDIDIDSEID